VEAEVVLPLGVLLVRVVVAQDRLLQLRQHLPLLQQVGEEAEHILKQPEQVVLA